MILKRGWQVVWVLLCLGCAGDLRDPGRFAFLYDTDGGASGSGGSSGSGNKDAGSGKDASSSMPPAAAPACVTALFKKTCGSIGCHAAGGTQVDLVSANVERRLVDKPSSTLLPCKGRTLVAADGSDSLLIDKITDPPPCGSPMPVTGSLSDDDRSCLTNWVSSLAD
jgi:hypothetical protein